MQKKTRRPKRVENMLYSKFVENEATRYGSEREEDTRQNYITYQQRNSHPSLKCSKTGLVISHDSPWLAASPDDRVYNPDTAHPLGLAEYKNPRHMTISEARGENKISCLEKKETKGEVTIKTQTTT